MTPSQIGISNFGRKLLVVSVIFGSNYVVFDGKFNLFLVVIGTINQ